MANIISTRRQRSRTSVVVLALLIFVLFSGSAAPAAAQDTGSLLQAPSLSVAPASGPAGAVVTLDGFGYDPGGYNASILWDGVDYGKFFIPEGGKFSTAFTIPPDASPGPHLITVCAYCGQGVELEQTASAVFEVMGSEKPTDTPAPQFVPPPVIKSFYLDQTTIDEGKCTVLHWIVESAVTVMLDSDFGNQPVAAAADWQVCPAKTLTYTLTAYGDKGAAPDSVTTTTTLVVNPLSQAATPTPTLAVVPPVFNNPPVIITPAPGGAPPGVDFPPGGADTLPLENDCQRLSLAGAETINFNDLGRGDVVADQYASRGVRFSGGTESLQIIEPGVSTASAPRALSDYFTTSAYDYGSANSGIAITFSQLQETVGMHVGLNAWVVSRPQTVTATLTGYNLEGRVVASNSVTFGPSDLDITHCLLVGARGEADSDKIARVILFYSRTPTAGLYEPEALDDLIFQTTGRLAVLAHTPPVVTINRPLPGQIIASAIVDRVQAAITDTDRIVTATVLVDGVAAGASSAGLTLDTGSGSVNRYTFSANISGRRLAEGAHTVTVVARDETGLEGRADVRVVVRTPALITFSDVTITQSGLFDPAEPIPSYLVAGKDGVLKLRVTIQDAAGNPTYVDYVGLQISGSTGPIHTVTGYRRTGDSFRVEPVVDGDMLYFFFPGRNISAGNFRLEAIWQVGGSSYSRGIGDVRFNAIPDLPAYFVAAHQALDAAGPTDPAWLDFLSQMQNMARAYPVRSGAAPIGAPGIAGLRYVVNPTALRLLNTGYVWEWDLIQSTSEGSLRAMNIVQPAGVDCNNDGTITGTEASQMLPRYSTTLNSNAPEFVFTNFTVPEDTNGNGVIDQAEMGRFVVEYFNGTRWVRYAGNESGFSPAMPYRMWEDTNRNCNLDEGESQALAMIRAGNLMSFMKGSANMLRDAFARTYRLPRMIANVLTRGSLNWTAWAGNCGASGACWSGVQTGTPVIAQEIAHGFGIGYHTPNGTVGVDAIDIPGRRIVPSAQAVDIMFGAPGGPLQNTFLGLTEYKSLFNAGRDGWQVYGTRSGIAAWAADGGHLAAPVMGPYREDQQFLTINGIIGPESATLLDSRVVQGGQPTLSDPASPYRLLLFAADGNVLSETAIAVIFATPCSGCPFTDYATLYMSEVPFSIVVTFSPETARFEIRNGETMLIEQTVSPNPPAVSLLSPQEGGTWDADAIIEVAWAGSDGDGDRLTYSLLYSNDGGATFIPLAAGLTQTSLALSAASLPGGDAVLQVEASDGIHTATDSRRIHVASKAPSVSIDAPREGAVFGERDVIALSATAFDVEDGLMDGASVVWHLEGKYSPLGQGPTVMLEGMTPGTHSIRVVATDSDGNVAESSVQITVNVEEPPAFLFAGEEAATGTQASPGQTDTASSPTLPPVALWAVIGLALFGALIVGILIVVVLRRR